MPIEGEGQILGSLFRGDSPRCVLPTIVGAAVQER